MPKSFKEAAASTKSVYETVIASSQGTQPEHAAQVVPVAPGVSQTQGRKGAKLPRINMAFTPQNLEYLRVMAGLRGQSITRYVNALVEQDMEVNRAAYDVARGLTGNN